MPPTSDASSRAPKTRQEAGRPDRTDGLGTPAPVPKLGWRDNIRSKPGLAQAWRVGVFATGLLCVVFGLALAVLPGPLTIPPVLLGLWIWSTEFDWAKRFFTAFKVKAKSTWAHAKRHPASSTLITVGGLAAAGAAIWAVGHYGVVDRVKELVGL